MTETQRQQILEAISPDAGYSAGASELNNLTGTGTVVSEDKILIPKPEILAMLSDSSIVNLQDFLQGTGEQARAFAYRWDTIDNMDMAHSVTRQSIQALALGGIVTDAEAANVLALGEREATLADDILGRKATAEDIMEARNG